MEHYHEHTFPKPQEPLGDLRNEVLPSLLLPSQPLSLKRHFWCLHWRHQVFHSTGSPVVWLPLLWRPTLLLPTCLGVPYFGKVDTGSHERGPFYPLPFYSSIWPLLSVPLLGSISRKILKTRGPLSLSGSYRTSPIYCLWGHKMGVGELWTMI